MDNNLSNLSKIVAFIPAREGSKGIPGKHRRLFKGKPLFFYALEAALSSKLIGKVFVSTDDKLLINLIKENFINNKVNFFDRLPEHYTNQAKQEPGLLYFAENNCFDLVLLIQATNPFVTSENLDNSINFLLDDRSYKSGLSVCKVDKFIWYKVNKSTTSINYNYLNRPNRQDWKSDYFEENGAFYAIWKEELLRVKNRLAHPIALFEMPIYTRFELDEEKDWSLLELLYERNYYDNYEK